MPDYYRGPAVHITHKVFSTRSPLAATYLINELSGVHIVVGELGARRVSGQAVIAGVAAAAVGVAEGLWHDPALALGLIFAAATLFAVGCARPRSPVHELRGWYHGADVCLFRSPDARVFGQVSRALMRALEARRDT